MTSSTYRRTDPGPALADLVSRYFASLDDCRTDLEWARRFFTEDATTVTPIGTVAGVAEIAAHTRTALGRFAATQHLSADLVSRYFASLDDRRTDLEWARRFFTEDATTVTPIGTVAGVAEIAAHTRTALGRFAATQHLSADLLLSSGTPTGTGDRPETREPKEPAEPAEPGEVSLAWNALMTHIHRASTLERRGPEAAPLFTVGGRCRAEARLTERGWRFTRLSITPLWHTGQPPVLPEELERELPQIPGG
ncbi:nuclear transport factor 2 family protein [Streptomyces physcomitrii]|uniref:SnoaL-like domain-containing protein n=1 Tax=Streptomyces physcomitrii TaxID=2724184 RepID=A0ABX1GVR4_9ACTN|nr:nuclear transport factor 2 family protein [Streptomyces physcomitrii]NKI39848.1 SnoaL-like domain-containing protein [Streptomyces physcomitrii]